MSELRIGVAGGGRMGRERARCLGASGTRIIAVYDIEPARGASFAADCATVSVAEFDELLACDAVFLCTPPNARVPMALKCVERGVPFFAEKPIALDAVAAEPVLRALERAPVVHSVGYMNRWRTSVRHAKQALEGLTILGMTAFWVNRPYRVPWWLDPSTSGGPHNEQATHLFDLSRHLCGDIEQVIALGDRTDRDVTASQTVASCLRFESGALGTILYSCGSTEKEIGMRIFTREGSVTFSTWDFTLVENTITHALPIAEAEDVFLTETEAFLQAVRSGVTDSHASGWADAMKTQRVVDAAAASITGQRQRGSVPIVPSDAAGPLTIARLHITRPRMED